jgi:hypothetical protein
MQPLGDIMDLAPDLAGIFLERRSAARGVDHDGVEAVERKPPTVLTP